MSETWKVEIYMVTIDKDGMKSRKETTRPYKTYDAAKRGADAHYKNWRQKLPTSVPINDEPPFILGNLPFEFPNYRIIGYIDGKMIKVEKKGK